MINHNLIFRQELKKISDTINKKHAILRKQVIKTCQVFENQNLPIFPYEVCFGLFHQVTETSSLSSYLLFLPLIQNIINLGFANQEMSREIIILLTNLKSMPKFHSLENSHRVQQIIMLLVSKNAVNLNMINHTHNILNILLSLQNHRQKSLWLKSQSIIIQITLLFINEVTDEHNNNNQLLLVNFLTDLVRLARNQNPKWLTENSEPYLFLSVLSEIVDQKYIKEHKSAVEEVFALLAAPIRKQINKVYENALSQVPNSPSKLWELSIDNRLILLLRMACKLSKLYENNFEILQDVIKIISEKNHLNHKILGYESINFLFSNCKWMHNMLKSSSGDLFNFLMTTLFNTIKVLQSEHRQFLDFSSRYDSEKLRIFQNNGIDFVSVEMTSALEIKYIIKNIDEISFTFFSIYSQIYKLQLDRKLQDKPPLQKTYKFCLKTVFQIIKSIMGRQMPEDTLQSILKISERFINLSGVFNDPGNSAMFIKLMCKYCLPSSFKSIGHRHVQINKMILNSANCLGNLFSTACWVTVWKALENYSIYYNRYLLGKEQLQAERQNDVQILYKSMDSIFTESPKYEDLYLINIIQSLVQVTYECLQNNYTEETKKIFAFERIQQIFKLNLFRITKIWPQLSSSLLILTTSKIQYFRISALGLLNTLIPISLQYFHNNSQGFKISGTNYEAFILEPWVNLASCPFAQIKTELALAVNKIIIDYGHIMSNGWKCILEIVEKLRDLTSLQAIIETFLDKINSFVMVVISIIDQIQRSLSDSNQKYLCLTLIWAIGDHAYKQNQTDVIRKIFELLLQPDQMFTLGTQARHSSFYILAELLVHNCAEKDVEFWSWIFTKIEEFYRYSILKCEQAKLKVNCDQILKNLLSNLLKIYRKCFLLLKEQQHKQFIKSKLTNFLILISHVLNFRQSEIYQSTLKQMKQLVALKKDLILELDSYDLCLQKLTEIYYIENDSKILKVLITYLPVDIYDIMAFTFSKMTYRRFVLTYKLLEKIFLIRLEAEQKDIKIHQMRIFFQDKTFLEFWKKFHSYFLSISDSSILKQFNEMLIKTLHKLILYEDYLFLSKMISFLYLLYEKYPTQLDSDLAIDFYIKILKLRTNQTWLKKFHQSKEIPIWFIASNQIVKLGYLFEKDSASDNCNKGYDRLFKAIYQVLSISKENKIKENISIDCLTSYYESESSLIYFLLDNYFLNPRNGQASEEQLNLLGYVEKISKLFNESDKSSKGKNTYDMLFRLASRKNEQDYSAIANNQLKAVESLLRRLFITFEQFIKFIKNGTCQQPDITNQIKFVLKKMLSLHIDISIYKRLKLQNIKQSMQKLNLESSLFQNSRSFLFMFHESLIKCTLTHNVQVRTLLADTLETLNHILILEIYH